MAWPGPDRRCCIKYSKRRGRKGLSRYVYRGISPALVGLAGLGCTFRRGRDIRLRRILRRRRCFLTLAHDCFRPAGHRLRTHQFRPVREVGLGMILFLNQHSSSQHGTWLALIVSTKAHRESIRHLGCQVDAVSKSHLSRWRRLAFQCGEFPARKG